MGKNIRITAMLLAVSLLLNMVVLPVHAEDMIAPTEQATETEYLVPDDSLVLSDTPTETETIAENIEETVVEIIEETEEETVAETEAEATEETVAETTEEIAEATTEETTTETEAEQLLDGAEQDGAGAEENLLLDPGEAASVQGLTVDGEVVAQNASYTLSLGEIFTSLENNTISINGGADLVLLSHVDPASYRGFTLKFASSKTGGFNTTETAKFNGQDYTFQGLGDSKYPFQGTIEIVSGTQNYPIQLNQPLFNELYDSAKIGSADLKVPLEYSPSEEGGDSLLALLAEKVTHDTTGAAENAGESQTSEKTPWYIKTVALSATSTTPPLIHIMRENANVSLAVNNQGVNSDHVPVSSVVGNGSAGYLCAQMDANSSLTLSSWTLANDSASLPNVTAQSGDAGALVGTMASGASLIVKDKTIIKNEDDTTTEVPNPLLSISNITASDSAGGIVGSATDANIKLTSLSAPESGAIIKGANAGGLIGRYTYNGGTNALSTVSYEITNITVNGSSNAGGVFGVLKNTSPDGKITIDSANVDTTLQTGASSGNAGGLIGQYSADALAATLSLQPMTVTSSLTGGANTYGGLIGWVSGDTAAYIEVQGKKPSEDAQPAAVTVKTKGTATNYGGLIGDLSDSGHMINTGTVTIEKKDNDPIKGTSTAGGLVGNMPSGVLRLNGTINAATPEGDQSNRGGILGKNGNTLVYATASGATGWPYYNSSSCNAIGNWGQVLRADKLPGLFTEGTHTVTVSDLTATNTISSVTDFAAAALRFQLSVKGVLQAKGALQFTGSDSVPTSLTVSTSVDLSETGITGFQRDYSSAEKVNVTLTGGENISITFPGITVYPTGSSHNRQGLFANVGDLKANYLELSGSITIDAKAGGTYAGGMAAQASGAVALTNVKSHVTITAKGTLKDEMLSGLIAFQNGGSLSFSECECDSTLRCDSNNSSFMGGFLARAQSTINSISVTNCKVGGSITKTGGNNYGGGFIGSLHDTNNASYNLTISGLEADGVTINTSGCNDGGGLMGWEWMNTTATISDVTIKNCELNAGKNSFGGLVYKGSGYWQVTKGTSSGIAFTGTNTISGAASSGASSGLLVCHGDKLDGHNNALYLEIHDGAYTIADRSVTLPEGLVYFDEIVGVTEGANGNGIVSYATGDKQFDQRELPDSYVNKRGTYASPNTRYYYNLDSFGAPASGDADSPEKMVLLSAYDHCYPDLQKYFYSEPGDITGDNLDLSGYSFYPLESFHNITGAIIKFAYEDMNKREAGNKPFSERNKQHYGMHTGIFLGVTGTAGGLTVKDLTLQGTVGGAGGNYGALIRDGASGKGSTEMLTLTLTDITLDNIKVIGDATVKPMLISNLGSYTTLKVDGVSTENYTEYGKAASSLIGNVGSEEGTNIQLSFANMDLDGRKSRSIFSNATFLESFRYRNASTCRGVYNFTSDVQYTVGQELSNSIKNPGQQYWFYQAEQIPANYVCGEDNDPATFFATDAYLRYVNQAESGTYHEIDVNLSSKTLAGCGTYSHPYVITSGDQLKYFADILSNTTPGISPRTWTINMNPEVLGKTFDKETPKTGNTHTCVAYTSTSTGWQKAGTTGDDTTATASNVAAYLRNAYYMIDGTITMPNSGWAGLGTSANPFSGVIVGSSGAEVNIPQTGSENQYGGLIKFSQGSVVKDLEIVYTGTPTVSAYSTNNNVPSSTDSASFFGGVVGWCLGGDTILDGVTVTYQNPPAVSGSYSYLTAVGGYVGMVGGAIMSTTANRVKYGGGVVFRNMTDSTGMTEGRAEGKANYFYYNPYVGRVLDGYVISEDTALDNTDKNYKIPNFVPNNFHLAYDSTNNKLLVSNDEGLWLMSAIANSGAGAIRDSNCLAYTHGKARTGTYGDVGGTLTGDDLADEGYLGGKEYKTKSVSYLTKYVDGNGYNLCGSAITIELSENGSFDMSTFGNGFRGIGISYGTNTNGDSNYRLLQVSGLNGNGNTVTLAQNRNEYTQEKDTWTSIGSGLFVLLRTSGDFTASDLTLTGKTGIAYYNGTTPVTDDTLTNTNGRVYEAGVGALAANLSNGVAANITVDNVKLDTLSVNVRKTGDSIIRGSTHAGGLFGSAKFINNNNDPVTLKLQDCTYSSLTVIGRDNAGGFLGYVEKASTEISYTKACELTSGNISTTLINNSNITGVGGLMGYWYGKDNKTYKLAISGYDENNPLTMTGLAVSCGTNDSGNDKAFCGGLAGLWYASNNEKVDTSIKNVSIQGSIRITGGSGTKSTGNTGGLVGAISNNLGDWKAGTSNMSVHVSDVHIADESSSTMTVEKSRQIGAVFGVLKVSKTVTIRNLYLGAGDNSVTVANRGQKNDQSAGGVIGIGSYAPTITMENLYLNGVAILGHYNTSISAGAVIGRHHNQNGSETMTMDMKNVELRNCTIAVDNDSSYAGLLYGQIHQQKQTITGTNILIEDCTVGLSLNQVGNAIQDLTNGEPATIGLKKSAYASYTALEKDTDYLSFTKPDNVGIFGGKKDGTVNVKLVGVSIQQKDNTLPMKDFGNKPSGYVIRADYTGAAAEAREVTDKPVSPLTIDGTNYLTGDGASYVKDAEGNDTKDTVAQKIWAASNATERLNLAYYSQIKDGSRKYLEDNIAAVTFSDYKTAGENTYGAGSPEPVNFPVIALQTSSSDELNKLLFSCISLLSNWEECTIENQAVTGAQKKAYYNLELSHYKWDGQKFVVNVNEADRSIRWNGSRFYLNPGKYDNQKGQFNLIDVQYYDPSVSSLGESTPIVYHLYIPVIVQKVFEFKFWAAAKIGTNYSVSDYFWTENGVETGLNKAAIASHGEPVTALLTYEYQWKKNDWQTAVDNGQNLLWNFQHQVSLTGEVLPVGTKLTLIDRQQNDQAYYLKLEKDSGLISFNEFTDDSGKKWSPVNLCDKLELKSTQVNDGFYFRLDEQPYEGETIKDAEGNHYRPADVGDDPAKRYNLSLGTDFEPIFNQFYLTIQTPGKSEIVNVEVECPKQLANPENGGLPTKRVKAGEKEYSLNDSENKVILGNFFNQKLTVTTIRGHDQELISAGDATIPIDLSTTIEFNDEESENVFTSYATGQQLYQCFELKLYENDGSSRTRRNIAPGAEITVQFYQGETKVGEKETYTVNSTENSLILRYPEDEMLAKDVGGRTLRAEVSLKYPSAATIVEQFPTKGPDGVESGIYVAATSNLAYTEASLKNTAIRSVEKEAQQGDHIPHYYRDKDEAATIYYCAYEDHNGSWAEGVSELGINGRDSDSYTIQTAALYDVSALSNAASAKKLRCTVTLLCQASDSTYEEPKYTDVTSIKQYLSRADVSALYTKENELLTAGTQGALETQELTFALEEGFSPDVPIQIPITLEVLTGSAFEGKSLTYANYRVRVSAYLEDQNGNEINGSYATDHIVYTNAKIYQGLVSTDIPQN